MQQLKDHYKTLGISANATTQEIKKAYRSLALQYHPDKNQDNTYSAAIFREIQEAYDTLSDPRQKIAYDNAAMLHNMGVKTKAAEKITPEWIMKESIRLQQYMRTVDTYRMSHQSLQEYIQLLLSDAHISILHEYADEKISTSITSSILASIQYLDEPYYTTIISRLLRVANGNNDLLQNIHAHAAQHQQQLGWKKTVPYVILIVTALLCVIMYLYAHK